MKRLPVVRHIRALVCVFGYVWSAASVWGMTEPTAAAFRALYKPNRERALRIWKGLE